MRILHAAVVLSALLATGTALADTTYIVDKVTITGSKTVPTAKLLASIHEHAGSRVSQADIVADQDAITKALGAANVVGGIKTSMATKPNKHIEVIFAIDDQGAQAPVVTKVAARLHAQIFDGNKSIPTDTLVAATGLHAGDELSNEKVLAAQQAIAAAYKAGKPSVGLSLNGGPQKYSASQYDLLWHIVETKAKPKAAKDDRSQEEKDQIQ